MATAQSAVTKNLQKENNSPCQSPSREVLKVRNRYSVLPEAIISTPSITAAEKSALAYSIPPIGEASNFCLRKTVRHSNTSSSTCNSCRSTGKIIVQESG